MSSLTEARGVTVLGKDSRVDTQRDYYKTQRRMERLARYYDWIFDQFRPFVKPGRLLDAGCGGGHLLRHLSPYGEVVAIDHSADSVQYVQKRFADIPGLTVRRFDLAGEPIESLGRVSFDTIITTDVAEHMQDDLAYFERLRSLLKKDGVLLVKVPAHPFLYGSVDRSSGHFRRYTRTSLHKTLEDQGFRVHRTYYMNMFTVALYFVRCKIFRRRIPFSETMSSRMLALINGSVPILALIERVLKPPFGLSVIGIAYK